ncbi:TPA: hypothetical protein NGT97_001350 [Vibrio parahaemolyticus]|nr:hypothetical protein [Vibrio parahaemolyticus]
MKKWLIILLFVSTSSFATLPVGITMDVMLQEFEDSANQTILSGTNAANNIVNNAAYNLIHSVAQIREDYEGALDKTSEELTIKQRQIFEGIQSRMQQVLRGIENEHDNIDDSLDNLAIYLSDSIFLSDEPRVSRFKSSIAVANSKLLSPMSIVFRGKNLNHPKNKLTLKLESNLTLEPKTRSDNEIIFSLPRNIIDQYYNSNAVTKLSFELILNEDWLFLFTKDKTYAYQVTIVPNNLAKATIVVKEKKW